MTDTRTADTRTPDVRRDPAGAAGLRRVRLDPWDVWTGPFEHLAPECERPSRLEFEHLEVRRLGATIGAELSGPDLRRPLTDGEVADIWRALLEFKVVFFRDQPLSAAQHVAFARRFGELELHPFIPSNTEQPELVRFSKHAEVGGYENGWHSDVSWRERPSMGAVLHALSVPAVGGDTLFCDMYAAYEGLAGELRDRIEHLTAVHDFTKVFGHMVDPERRAEMHEQYPPVEHPVVRTHPETGRRILYVNRFFVDHIVGLDRRQSDQLIDRLARQAETVEYQCRFAWARDSVAFWDNRAVQHYASSDYWPQPRVMERASIVGDRPRS